MIDKSSSEEIGPSQGMSVILLPQKLFFQTECVIIVMLATCLRKDTYSFRGHVQIFMLVPHHCPLLTIVYTHITQANVCLAQ